MSPIYIGPPDQAAHRMVEGCTVIVYPPGETELGVPQHLMDRLNQPASTTSGGPSPIPDSVIRNRVAKMLGLDVEASNGDVVNALRAVDFMPRARHVVAEPEDEPG